MLCVRSTGMEGIAARLAKILGTFRTPIGGTQRRILTIIRAHLEILGAGLVCAMQRKTMEGFLFLIPMSDVVPRGHEGLRKHKENGFLFLCGLRRRSIGSRGNIVKGIGVRPENFGPFCVSPLKLFVGQDGSGDLLPRVTATDNLLAVSSIPHG